MLKKVLENVREENLVSPEKFLAELPIAAAGFFLVEKFPEAWKKVLNNLPARQEAAVRAFHEWFDGLKTLRFLHFFSGFMKKI